MFGVRLRIQEETLPLSLTCHSHIMTAKLSPTAVDRHRTQRIGLYKMETVPGFRYAFPTIGLVRRTPAKPEPQEATDVLPPLWT